MSTTRGGNEMTVFSNPEGIAEPNGYSHVGVVPAGLKTVHIAGQLGCGVDRKLAGAEGDFEAQANQAFANVRCALRSVGADFRDVVKMNTYIVDIAAHMPTFRKVRNEWLAARSMPPVTTTVGVPGLAIAGALIEIEAVATVPGDADCR